MVIYILSISFQVAGALLLMVNALSTRRDRVIHRFASHSLIYRDNNTGELEYDKEALKGAFKEAYLSKFAFAEIASACAPYINLQQKHNPFDYE